MSQVTLFVLIIFLAKCRSCYVIEVLNIHLRYFLAATSFLQPTDDCWAWRLPLISANDGSCCNVALHMTMKIDSKCQHQSVLFGKSMGHLQFRVKWLKWCLSCKLPPTNAASRIIMDYHQFDYVIRAVLGWFEYSLSRKCVLRSVQLLGKGPYTQANSSKAW